LGDFDQDGLLDVAISGLSFGPISLFRGGSFELTETLPGGDLPEVLRVADLDGDSDPDLAVMNDGGASVTIYQNLHTVHRASVQFQPSAYQLATAGRDLSAEVTLPTGVDPDLDPSQVNLLAECRSLGRARGSAVVEPASRRVVIRFAREALNSLEPGLETLSVFGCDRQGAYFRATSTLKVLPRRQPTLWQTSLPGALPVLIQVPDEADPEVEVRIYDSSGRVVRVQRSPVAADNRIAWDGRSNSGDRVPSAVYLAVVERAGRRQSCKLVLLR
jgi:hypothetical protein